MSYKWMPYIHKRPKKKRLRYNKYKFNIEHQQYYRMNRGNREIYIQTHPLCELCEIEGMYVPFAHLHHIKEISSVKDPEDKVYITTLEDNFMSLCEAHHKQVHNEPDKLTDKQREYLANKQRYVEALYILHKYNKENDIETR